MSSALSGPASRSDELALPCARCRPASFSHCAPFLTWLQARGQLCMAPSVLPPQGRQGLARVLNFFAKSVPDESLLDSLSSSCRFYTRTVLLGNWSETSNPSNGGLSSGSGDTEVQHPRGS